MTSILCLAVFGFTTVVLLSLSRRARRPSRYQPGSGYDGGSYDGGGDGGGGDGGN
ncbi:hypothetical protein [Actinoplanes sp. NPDC049265]|uniref:hypothetical protein n=1 Tax=Actinoplanes sp. NPDC049265 TaxID=3363902 RepID=UPI003714298F